MRIVDFADGYSSSAAPIQGLLTATSLGVYANDAAFVTAKGSAAAQGDSYYNTTLLKARTYSGTTWGNIGFDGGKGQIDETAFTFANNQATANVTGLVFDSTKSLQARCEIAVTRRTSTTRQTCTAVLWLSYDAVGATWLLDDYEEHGPGSGITWSVTSAGQVQYATDNMSGSSYSGASHFKATTMGT